MVRYIYINLHDEEKSVFFDDKSPGKDIFICSSCYKTFSANNLNHLMGCNLGYPYEYYKNCQGSRYPSCMIFRIDSAKNPTNRKIINSITKLGGFSKLEQGLDFQVTVKGLLDQKQWWPFGHTKYYIYCVFEHKEIVSYCLVQEYPKILRNKNVVLRDLYTIPPARGKGYATKLINSIAKDNSLEIEDLWFNRPLTLGTKKILKNFGIEEVRTLYGEDPKSARITKI